MFFSFFLPHYFWLSGVVPRRSESSSRADKKINEDPKNVDLRFELAMEYASTGWIELGWDQLKLVPKLEKRKTVNGMNERVSKRRNI